MDHAYRLPYGRERRRPSAPEPLESVCRRLFGGRRLRRGGKSVRLCRLDDRPRDDGRIQRGHHGERTRKTAAAPAQGIKVDPKGRKISVAFDFKGKLHYGQPVQETGEQIVTVVSDRVCDEYIEELRQSGVGVVAVPVNGNELVLAMEQLDKDYGDGVWMLEGGAIINAAFIQAGLVDEVSTVIYPAIDATKESPAIYEAAQEGVFPAKKLSLRFKESKILSGGAVWLNYEVVPAK